MLALAAGLAGACAGSGSRQPDAALVDTGAETVRETAAAEDAAVETGIDGPPAAGACTSDGDCPAGLCGLRGGTCVARVQAVAAGTSHSCSVHQDGRVSCWGYGAFIGPGLPAVISPLAMSVGGKATAVQVGIQAACALLEGGGVSCWGDLDGRGPQEPAAVLKEDGMPLGGITHLAGGSLAFCGSSSEGVWCWGHNQAGELARPPAMTFPARTAVLADPRPRPLLAATVAILTHDGADELCGWGNNDSGILPGARGAVERPRCQRGVGGVLQLTAGDGHVCVRRAGAMFSCWGSNSGGQLGVGDDGLLDAEMPGSIRALPAPIVSLASAAYHSCAVLVTGAVLCWGGNEHGEVGLAPSAPQFSPRLVGGFAGKVVALGAGAGAQHTCAVLADGRAQCWGYDHAGQLGAAAATEDADRFSPAPLTVRF
jgi:alpha-tubulin suppressor-like RCC1 family protein